MNLNTIARLFIDVIFIIMNDKSNDIFSKDSLISYILSIQIQIS